MPATITDNSGVPTAEQQARSGPALTRFPAMMWGIFFLCIGFAGYVLGVLLAALRYFLSPGLREGNMRRFPDMGVPR